MTISSKKLVRIAGLPALQSMGSLSIQQKSTVHDSVPRLASRKKDGRPYERSANVQAEIRRVLSLPQSNWATEAESLQNETLVFLIRRTHGADEELCGSLLEELRTRILDRVR